jgi:3-hydroxybutyrate dehydrogenase
MTSQRAVALVTGSTSGVGLGIAEALAAEGMDLVINGAGEAAEIEEIRGRLAAQHQAKVLYCDVDMADADAVRGMVAHATRELGHVDVLVNNAGAQHLAWVHEFPRGAWDTILAINLSAVFHATAAVLPQMLERDWGRIVNVASVHGLVASSQRAAYVAAKHGVIGFTKVVALETADSSITCNAICPGWVLTPLMQRQIDELATREHIGAAEAQTRLMGGKQPSQGFVTPSQIGALTAFLCSEDAAQIRGAALPMDGAWLAQ